jgi:serine/threonine protein kinase/tetratricopeptide (TPR) repeat protein
MLGAVDGFQGTKRFVVEGHLGEGGMGVVHRARDTERAEVVALKTMTRLDPGALLRFKREFRALADISHPNVVQLYELFSEGGFWFFTMELVDGCDFLTWIRSSLSVPPPSMTDGPTSGDRPTKPSVGAGGAGGGGAETVAAPTEYYDSMVDLAPVSERAPVALPLVRKPFGVRDEGRLRGALRQLAAGVAAIHAAGKLHRDIKPSNVMVTVSGRVVLLDFGVVGEFRAPGAGERSDEPIVGTPAYMAPEQAAFRSPTPAADWYAVGVILFEALTGQLPFDGETRHVLLAKQRPLAIRPSDLVHGIPPDLEKLCLDLLSVDPAARPTAEQVIEHLEGDEPTPLSASFEQPFVGRRALLAELHAAFDASLKGAPVATMLHGRSGMGKSALAARFLHEVATRTDALVLSGRCYEREAVPFKAVDQVMDELCRWLAGLPEDEVLGILPRDVQALARLFPVLRNVRAVAELPEADVADRLELRRNAFDAMKDLLSAIGARRPVVIHVDDLQWGDADSVQLLEAILTTPSPRPLFLLCGHRSELAATSRALDAMRAARERLGSACTFREVEVGRLATSEARELARALLGPADTLADTIAAEAQGSPLFVEELARWTRERQGSAPGASVALDEVIRARVARLSSDARSLLETVGVARGPIAHAVAEAAAGLGDRKRSAAIALRAARLVSTRGFGDDDEIETAHDRIRETVAGSLRPEARRDRHLALAKALVGAQRPDPEAAFEHFRAGGDGESARRCALEAADAADGALAFLHAADLYRAAIALGAKGLDTLHAKLGDALANAGRGWDAADAYMEAASHAPAREAVQLQRTAADHYMRSGRSERGLEVLRTVLDAVGLRYPESTEAAIAALAWGEARVRLAPLVRRVRGPQSVSLRDLERIDTAFVASSGLAMSDTLRSADFATRGLLLALEAGEPMRLCRALVAAASNAAAVGEPGRRRSGELVRAAERIAEQIDDPYARASALVGAAFMHFFLGEWRTARDRTTKAEALLRTRCRAVEWELAHVQTIACNTLILTGDLRDAAQRVPGILEGARARSDRFAILQITYPACVALIMADDVTGATRVTRLVNESEFTFAHWGAFIGACSVDRYSGDARAAWERVERFSPVLEKSHLMRAALVRTCLAYERGLSAVAAARTGFDRARALKAAEKYARDLSREKLPFGRAMGQVLRAGAHAVRGDRDSALGELGAAIPMLDAADLGYLAACARHRRGELLGGSAGRDLVAQSRAFFEAQEVKNIERCLAMSAPGYEAYGP